ncbi:MAG: dihydroorotate dehydrogenase electron transfer subunit [Tidjanibacter sp.]|nr:dihydroorotate dehydrogenase electron transfer subunit [Tidjanibacter sp.]
MYKQGIYKIVSNSRIAKSVYKMVLEGDTQYVTAPGQFVNIELEGKFLRRPISVCDYDERAITIIYKVVGAGTEQMSHMAEGEELDVLTGLGNGFDTSKAGERNLLVGGGVGVPPMYNLAKTLKAAGRQVSVVMGFNAEDEIFYAEEFKALGVDVYVATADGSVGTKGFVTDVIREKALQYDYFFTCGPLPMLKALYDATGEIGGQLSFEERMGCGFGACMGCSCQTKYGTKRICKDGPVLLKEEVIW